MRGYYKFKNEPLPDFTNKNERKKMKKAIEKVRKEFGTLYSIVIGGIPFESDKTFYSINPNKPSEIIGEFFVANKDHIDTAVDVAKDALKKWRNKSLEERAEHLFRLAKVLKKKKYEISALMVLEVGKNWLEAVADINELIDFCNFYGKEAVRLSKTKPRDMETEEIDFRYEPIGVGAIIAPWNFPSAILGGMTTAAIVMGNAVLMKPASDAPATAYAFFKALNEAGIPLGVVNYITGSGGITGNAILEHDEIKFIAFTGSRDVGKKIYEKIAKPGKRHFKVVPLLEMGGKDGIRDKNVRLAQD